jgi:TRAP-type C4-dicarboxylate transport system permease small subunit
MSSGRHEALSSDNGTGSSRGSGLEPVRSVVRGLAAAIHAVALAGLVLSGLCLVFMLLATSLNVIGRYTGWWTILGADEMGAYAMAATFFFGLAYTFRSGAFIAVRPFHKRIPSRFVPTVEVLQLAIALAYTLVLLWYVWKDTKFAYDLDVTTVGVHTWPLWIPQVVMPIGCAVLALQIVSLILERIFLGRPAPSSDLEHPVETAVVE